MKNTLCNNERLILEILDKAYIDNLSTKTIYRSIKKKISPNSIRKIKSDHKLYLDFKRSTFMINDSS